jgi:glycosyltransferase involved in cell wall biosynthesis
MRIGFVVAGGFDRSGRERVVPVLLGVVERLARRHDVHVFVLDYYPEPCTYPLLGASIHDLGRVDAPPGLRRLRTRRRLHSAIVQHGPFDLLHAYWGMPGVAATAAARRLHLPCVVTLASGELVRLDDIQYGLQRRWLDRRAIGRVLREASAITVPTTYTARLATAAGATPRIVPFGIDPETFPLRRRIDGPPWRLIRVGSINRVKDYPTLLRAFALLSNDVHLDIVGEDTLAGSIGALARTVGVSDRVTFHGGQPTTRVAELFAGAHLNLVSSRHESSNVTMLEAACSGIATVGTNVGYVADWHPDRALAVPTNDPAALAGAIDLMLRDHARRAGMAEAARAWTIAHDVGWTVRTLEDLYGRAITGR